MSVNTDYDIHLGGTPTTLQGYRVRSFVRDSAPLVAARFSTGAQGQTDLDLLKSASVDLLAGGMFQRKWETSNTNAVARAIGVYNKYDDNIYPVPPRATPTAETTGYSLQAVVESEKYSFMSLTSYSAPTFTNRLVMLDRTGARSTPALPAGLSTNILSGISGMCFHKKYLYIAQAYTGSAGASCFRYDIAANTWQDIGGIAKTFFTIRGQLYCINYANSIFAVTNEEAAGAATYTVIDVAGSAAVYPESVTEFNGAAWISKEDGIFRFDGVRAIKVLKMYTHQLKEFQGYLYFFAGKWLYSFDGTNVKRLQFFGADEPLGYWGLASNSDYLFLQTDVIDGTYSGVDKGVSVAGGHRIYMYDGVGFTLLDEKIDTTGIALMGIVCNNSYVYEYYGYTNVGVYTQSYTSYDLTKFFSSTSVSTTYKLDITTSEFDDGYPNIYKALELIYVDYNGIIAGDSIAVTYQLYNGQTWGSWNTAGTLTSSTTNDIEIVDINNKLFKAIKINVTVTPASASTIRIKGISLRYTLQPRGRWRWQVGIMASGNKATYTRNNTEITADSNELSNAVTKAVKQKTPLYMLSPDYALVDTGGNAAALTFVLGGQVPLYTDPYNEYPMIAIKNASGLWEILKVTTVTYSSGTDKTTIVVQQRGYLGITAATINAAAEVRLCYKVYITRLLREATILDDNTYAQQTSGESQIQREFMLEITEV